MPLLFLSIKNSKNSGVVLCTPLWTLCYTLYYTNIAVNKYRILVLLFPCISEGRTMTRLLRNTNDVSFFSIIAEKRALITAFAAEILLPAK